MQDPKNVSDLSWKFHKNLFTNRQAVVPRWGIKHGSINRKIASEFKGLTATTSKMPQIILSSHVWTFLKMSWKSIHPFSRNVVNRHISLKKRKNIPYIQWDKGYKTATPCTPHIPRFARLFLYHAWPILKISLKKSVHPFFHSRHTNKPHIVMMMVHLPKFAHECLS